ncbi:TlpA family protein disulfide reductase [Nocardioides korecus]
MEQIKPVDRVKVPPVQGRTLDGAHFESRDHLGNVLVINVWGSWCAPCRAEAPVLRRVSSETKRQGVQFVGIDVRDNDAAAIAFERRYKITYPSIATADAGQAILAFGSMLPRNAIPSTLVVDREGRVAARVVGRTTYATLHTLVSDAVAESKGGTSRP